jgi:hypothetical protein
MSLHILKSNICKVIICILYIHILNSDELLELPFEELFLVCFTYLGSLLNFHPPVVINFKIGIHTELFRVKTSTLKVASLNLKLHI